MTERYFEDINPEHLPEQLATERAMAEYADAALANSVVSVEVHDCKHPFLNLPKNIANSLADLPKPPKQISGVDLRLSYDPAAQMFITKDARLRFDTDYSLIFHRIQAPQWNKIGLQPLYLHAIMSPVDTLVRKSAEAETMTEKEVAQILKAIDIGVPESPQEASWNEIKAILQFAGLWTAQTMNTVPLDPSRTVTITDCVEGSSMDSSTTTLDSDDGFRERTVTFSIDEAARPTEPPTSTWKLIAKSNNRIETPCIQRLERTPLEYRMPVFEDYGIEVVLDVPYIRHELSDQSVEVPLDNTYLLAARLAIDEARELL